MLETKNALLLRYVDDFLFVSHEKGEALAFLKYVVIEKNA